MKKILFSKNERGFTLIELLVVIAIIAVLSSLAFVGLQNARRRGNDVAMLATMNGIRVEAQICLDQTGSSGLTGTISASGGTVICATAGSTTTYPTPITAWSYGTAVSSSVSDGTFTYTAASSLGGTKSISCTETKCTASGF